MERLWEVFFCIIIAPFELSSARLGVSLSLEQTFVHTTTAAMITTTKTNQILITAKPERSTLSLDLWTNFLGGNKSLFRWFAQGLKCCAQNGKNESSLRAFDVTFWKWFNAYFLQSYYAHCVSNRTLNFREHSFIKFRAEVLYNYNDKFQNLQGLWLFKKLPVNRHSVKLRRKFSLLNQARTWSPVSQAVNLT